MKHSPSMASWGTSPTRFINEQCYTSVDWSEPLPKVKNYVIGCAINMYVIHLQDDDVLGNPEKWEL